MNRQQRRMLAHGHPPAGLREERHDINIQYGADEAEKNVLIGFNRPIDNLRLEPQQVLDMIDKLQKCLEYLKATPSPTEPRNG